MDKPQLMRLTIRVYKLGVLQSVEHVDVTGDAAEDVLPNLAEKHAKSLVETPGHIEIEFVDEPDVTKRFFRIGTDPNYMVKPRKIGELDDALKKWEGLQ